MELSPGDTTAIISTPLTSMTRVREIFVYGPTGYSELSRCLV